MFFFSYFNEVLGVQMEFINAQIYLFAIFEIFLLDPIRTILKYSSNFNTCAHYSWKKHDGIRGVCQLSDSWFFGE